MPKISVALPVYNGARFVEHTIRTILGQTLADLELVISDNASTDETGAICRRFAAEDTRVRYLRQPKNCGAAANYNAALAQCTGGYVKWAAHDDLIAPTFLEKCADALDRNGDAVLCASATQLIGEDDAPLRPTCRPFEFVDGAGRAWQIEDDPDWRVMAPFPATRFAAFVGQPSKCFEFFGVMRRSALDRTELLGRYWGADKVLLAELSLLGRFVRLDEPLFLRRCHHAQSSMLTQRDREQWMGARRARHSFQQGRMLFEYMKILARHGARGLPPQDLIQCVAFLARRAFRPKKIRQVGRSLLGLDYVRR